MSIALTRIIDGWQGSVEQAALVEGIQLSVDAFRSLEAYVPPLQWVEWRDGHNWQYVERLPSQAIVQKVSTANQQLYRARAFAKSRPAPRSGFDATDA